MIPLRLSPLAIASLLAAGTAPAQVLPNGKGQVEFAGLEQWTPERIRQQLTKGQDVDTVHYCAANLIQDVGMIDAAVLVYPGEGDGTYYFVTVIEPDHAERVRYLPAIEGAPRAIEAWSGLAEALRGRSIGAQMGLVHYARFLRDGEERALQRLSTTEADREQTVRVWQELQRLDDPSDHERALWALAHDPDTADRECAAAILMNFADHDITWWALTDGMRDAEPAVRSTCGQAVLSMVHADPEPVDWEPAARSLRFLLGGTNLFALSHVLDMLTATSVSPDLAGPLLGDNGSLVLAYLGASLPRVRAQAHEFLKTIGGTDRGTEVAAWQSWLDGLAGDR